ncbi:LysM peptidoglycan-binding domain-containing protein [Solwaraspora sp. WMMD791]|uniref:LysM peptidoglycan-binding domain-containing protein n=1 Tax=Solwaraspora sp. WMMD791 TaxID=3016086 RepID=UPI00249C01B3|nr:LysM peptidoglycan-binding domain-containing protein [Solwaraspora sp. WMMD791]WFE25556.1 LysM peptidoglycan-binding domain-containing protein [Solwaraspora sp. WMMD791]
MSTTRVTPARRLGQVVTGLGALIVLLILLAGAPVALLAFAGNPLPDEVPSAAAIGAALTSRDDGQLFLRALAVVGWLGWATFLVSVLVEVPARLLRRPAPRLPGLNRQQRVAAALIGSISLILVASPAAAFAAPGTVEATTVVAVSTGFGAAPADAKATAGQATAGQATDSRPTPHQLAGAGQSGPLVSPAALHALATAPSTPDRPDAGTDAAAAEPVYRVANGDYLGHIADRYLGEFGDYRQLAALNEIDDPDRIRAGQLLRLPADATDTGVRPHANGTVLTPAAPRTPAPPATEQPAPQPPAAGQPPTGQPTTPPPTTDVPSDAGTAPAQRPAWQIDDDAAGGGNLGGGVSAGSPGPQQNLNRPLAVAAVITAASIVGAQIGTVLGLKRRTAGAPTDSGRHRRYRD